MAHFLELDHTYSNKTTCPNSPAPRAQHIQTTTVSYENIWLLFLGIFSFHYCLFGCFKKWKEIKKGRKEGKKGGRKEGNVHRMSPFFLNSETHSSPESLHASLIFLFHHPTTICLFVEMLHSL